MFLKTQSFGTCFNFLREERNSDIFFLAWGREGGGSQTENGKKGRAFAVWRMKCHEDEWVQKIQLRLCKGLWPSKKTAKSELDYKGWIPIIRKSTNDWTFVLFLNVFYFE